MLAKYISSIILGTVAGFMGGALGTSGAFTILPWPRSKKTHTHTFTIEFSYSYCASSDRNGREDYKTHTRRTNAHTQL